MDTHVYPAERVWHEQVEASGDPYFHPPVMEELKRGARERGLWNLFLPDERFGAGLTNLEYAPLAEITGRSHIAPEAINCAAPDTGNMEILTEFGTAQQQQRLARAAARGRDPLVLRDDRAGGRELRRDQHPEPHRARRRRVRHRPAASGGRAARRRERCKIAIFMGVSDPEADPHRRHSMILVPLDTPGVEIVRTLPVFGYDQGHGGHCEVIFDDVRVPAENMLGEEGSGFAIAQARLGPGPHPPLHARDRHGRARLRPDVRARPRADARSASRSPARA